MVRRLKRIARRIALISVIAILATAGAGLAVLFIEGSAAPDRTGEYVALGSSFAAGPQLSPRPAAARPYDELANRPVDIVSAVRQRSPRVSVALMT